MTIFVDLALECAEKATIQYHNKRPDERCQVSIRCRKMAKRKVEYEALVHDCCNKGFFG